MGAAVSVSCARLANNIVHAAYLSFNHITASEGFDVARLGDARVALIGL